MGQDFSTILPRDACGNLLRLIPNVIKCEYCGSETLKKECKNCGALLTIKPTSDKLKSRAP